MTTVTAWLSVSATGTRTFYLGADSQGTSFQTGNAVSLREKKVFDSACTPEIFALSGDLQWGSSFLRRLLVEVSRGSVGSSLGTKKRVEEFCGLSCANPPAAPICGLEILYGAFLGRAMIEKSAFHREAFRPAGMNHVIGITKRLAVGEAVFAMGYENADAPALIGGKAEIFLNLLLPAFAHAFEALDWQARNYERLQRAIAESDMDVRVRDGAKGSEPGAGAFLTLPLPGPDASFLAISPPDAATLATRLAEHYGLTKRQEDIAQCLLDGLSTKDAAARLGISLNTARRHCEAVLNRTGAHRRGELNRIARALTSAPPTG